MFSVFQSFDSLQRLATKPISHLTCFFYCFFSETDHLDTPVQFYIQHLIRKLGSEPYIGQRVILSVSQRISVAAESLLFMNPFDDAFPNLHGCVYVM